jgi:hypothetical protein
MNKPNKSPVIVVKRTVTPLPSKAKTSLGVANLLFDRFNSVVSKKPSRGPSRLSHANARSLNPEVL